LVVLRCKIYWQMRTGKEKKGKRGLRIFYRDRPVVGMSKGFLGMELEEKEMAKRAGNQLRRA